MPTFRSNYRIIIISIIIALILFCFYQNLFNGFINYDDGKFVYSNDNVVGGLSVESIIWAFTTTYMGVWHPLTWISHIIDCELFDLNAGGHHLSSIIFHLLNSLLLFKILSAMTGTTWRSALVTVIFAIHPLHVESVSWIAVRKDLVSTFFILLSIRSYMAYVHNAKWKNHLMVTLFFALALMSKPMVIFLPILFILLDFWPLGRLENKNRKARIISRFIPLLKEKVIWFALSGLILIVNFMSLSKAGWITTLTNLSLIDRIANVPYVIFHYVYKSLYPVSLSVFYPYPKPPGSLAAFGGILVILLLTLMFFKLRKSKSYLLFGWLWFLVGLLPVMGLIQQAQHLVADRYMYIPLIGLSIIFVWGIYDAIRKIKGAIIIFSAISFVVIISLAVLSFKQTGVWKSSLTLFENALRINENNHVAHANLGAAFHYEQNYKKAIYHYSRAIEIKPYFSTKDDDHIRSARASAHAKLGKEFLEKNEDSLALEQFLLALKDDSSNVANLYNVGNFYLRRMQYNKAIGYYEQAIAVDSNSPEVYNNLAVAFLRSGEYSKAEKLLKDLLNANQEYFVAAYNLARVYSAMNEPDAAVERLRQAIGLGFTNWQLIKNDPDLDNIRKSKAFLDLLKQNNQSS